MIRALRRRYLTKGGGDDACPYALLTKKVKTRRVYRAVKNVVGSSLDHGLDLDGWEMVLGAVGDASIPRRPRPRWKTRGNASGAGSACAPA